VVHLESVVINYISCIIIYNHRMHFVHVYPCLCEIDPFVLPFGGHFFYWRLFASFDVWAIRSDELVNVIYLPPATWQASAC
jgi:hypothetical protein